MAGTPRAWVRRIMRLPTGHHDPATVHAMLEDYRAGLGVDRAADEADRAAGRRISCPTLELWSSRDDLEYLYGDVLAVWEPWTTELHEAASTAGTTWQRKHRWN